ncbi:hypothetical protein Tco_0763231 [Tanacetum coccineum]
MSKSAKLAPTPTDSVVRNTAGKGSKQTTDDPMPDEKLHEFCDKHYNQLLPLMAEKVHQEKLQVVQARLTYGESSRRNSQTKEKTRLSESESCDKKMRSKKRRKPSPSTMSRGSYPSQSPSVFSMLKHGEPDSPRRRSPITTVFTRLGDREKNVSTRLGERERGVFSRLRRESTSRHRQTSAKRDASVVRDPNHRRREARNLVRSYVNCSSERQREIKREWDATDRANRRNPSQDEERYLSESENDGGGHWKSKKQKSTTDEEDLSQPWLTEIIITFT